MRSRSKWLSLLVCLLMATCCVVGLSGGTVAAQDSQGRQLSPYETMVTDKDGRQLIRAVFPLPPPKTTMAVANVPDVHVQGAINALTNVPAFDWSYGCSATSAAMLFGYYDHIGYNNMYTGQTDGGLCPLNNSVWGEGECPVSASHNGIDGRTTRGHVDDYWIDYGSAGPDPYVGQWAQHSPLDCTGDYMGTNQWKYGNPVQYNTDGGTIFFFDTTGDPLYDYTGDEPTYRDGAHGMRLFAESRGYTVTAVFNQRIDGFPGTDPGKGFTFQNFQTEIDAGRPVLIHVTGHSMLGYGYNTTGNNIYVHDTWDYSNHTMTWGGTYPYGTQQLQHYGVTVIRLQPVPPNVTNSTGASSVTYTSARLNGEVTTNGGENPTVHIYWGPSDGGTTTGNWAHDVNLGIKAVGTFYTDVSGLTASVTYYYRCYATNTGGGSWASSAASFVTTAPPSGPTNVHSTSHSTSTWSSDNTVQLSWTTATAPTSGLAGYSTWWATAGATDPNENLDTDNVTTSATSPALADGSNHYFHIRAKDLGGYWGDVVTAGPFFVDAVAPTGPTSIQSSSHSLSVWSSDNTVSMSWTAATDNGSGLAGYAAVWDADDDTTPVSVNLGVVTSNVSAPLADGNEHWFHIRAVDVAGNYGSAVHFGPFYIETVPPVGPTELTSPSHIVSTWSSNNTITVTLTAATDATSGLDGYGIWFSTSPTTDPTVKTAGALLTGVTSSALADGVWWFHIRPVDVAGNWGTTVHLGPFWIDAHGPTGPTGLSSGNHTAGVWSSDNIVSMTWTAASDNMSGLAGYGIVWDTSPGTDPTSITDNTTSANSTRPDGNANWFHIQARDNVGNWGETKHLGPFYIDTALPAAPTGLTSPSHALSTWSSNTTVTANWTAATDGLSGIAGYSIVWDTSSNTTPPTTRNADNVTSTISTALAGGNSYYFHIRPVDLAGNWGSAAHLGPFWIDPSGPSGPTGLSSATHTASVWSSDNTVAVSWTAATDNLSGLAGYGIVWDTSDSTTPTTVNTANTTTSLTSPELADGTSHYFHIRARDSVGNWGSTVHLGPFYIDVYSPRLTGGAVSPASGYPTTAFTFSVNYTHPLELAPAEVKVVIDGSTYRNLSLASGNFSAGAVYTGIVNNLTVGTHSFAFEASDNATPAHLAVDDIGVRTGPVVEAPPSGGLGGLGGGGGGGGGAVGPGVTNLGAYTNGDGLFNLAVVIKSEDGKAILTIAKGVQSRTKDGLGLTSIKIAPLDSPPAPPADSYFYAHAYEFTPEGATFVPGATLTILFDPAKLPTDIDTNTLTIAVWNAKDARWDLVQGTLNRADSSVTIPLEHFSVYTLVGKKLPPPPAPASFTISDVKATPVSVTAGQMVTITAKVTNGGGTAGECAVELKVNGVAIETKKVTVSAGASETVTFSVTQSTAGRYDVSVNSVTASFTVVAPEPAVTVEPAQTTTTTGPPHVRGAGNWVIIVVIVVGALLIAGLVLVIVRARRRSPAK